MHTVTAWSTGGGFYVVVCTCGWSVAGVVSQRAIGERDAHLEDVAATQLPLELEEV